MAVKSAYIARKGSKPEKGDKSAGKNSGFSTQEELRDLVPGHWVVVEPKTGRTHQIRVHLAFLGKPVLGDGLYGGQSSDRLWLHAWKLRLKHPITGEEMEFVAEPERFRKPLVGAQPA